MRYVRLEPGFPADPVCTFARYGTLGELVAQPDFKIGTEQTALSVQPGYIELPFLLFGPVGRKGGRGKDKVDTLHLFQLLLQCLVGIDGKAGCRNRYLSIAR